MFVILVVYPLKGGVKHTEPPRKKKIILGKHLTKTKIQQELQEVLKFPIETFWNLEARHFK